MRTHCFDRRTGKELWQRIATVGKSEDFHETEGSPAASTPVTDGRRVMTYFGSGGLYGYDFNGKELWHYPLPTAETDGGFGTGSSPLWAGNRVILNRDERSNPALLALDVATGKVAWETSRPDPFTSYGTPMLWKNGGRDQIVVGGAASVLGYSLEKGEERWVVRGTAAVTCTTPVAGDGLLVFAAWSPGKGDMPGWEMFSEKQDKNRDGKITREELDAGSKSFFKVFDFDRDGFITAQDWDGFSRRLEHGKNVMVAVKPGGSGDITETHVAWSADRGLPYVSSPLFYRGRIYLVKDGGMVTCVEAASGKPVYTQERLKAQGTYYASPIAADGRVYLVSGKGQVTVLKAGTAQPEVLHETNLDERVMATPALVENQIILRTATKLYALGEKH